MTEKQKKVAISKLRTLYLMADFMENKFGAASKQHTKALAMYYGACDMIQTLYGEDVEKEVREKAVTTAY